jgi:putative ABC transport system permease protein
MPFVLAGVFGFGVSLLGAYIPARRASRLSPHEGMGVVVPGDVEGVSYKFLIVGTLLSLGSGSVLALSIAGRLAVDTAVVASVFLLLGVVLLLPAILSPLSSVVVLLLGIFSRVEARLAQRQILRHRARSTLTIGVLFVASSTGLGMASSILDNVRDVKNWYRQAIVGDFFVRAMMPDMATGLSADLPEGLGEEIRAIPGIRDIDTVRFVVARAEGQGVIVIIREFTAEDSIYFDVESGNPDTMRGQLFDGEVVVGSVLAQRAELKAGDRIELETREGTQQLRIAGVVNDYLVGGLTIHMERETAKRLLNVEGVDAYIIRADRQHLPAIGEQLQILCDEYGLLLHSFADISSMIDAMIRGIDACLWGLVMLGFVVAAFGVVNTLTMNVLEQTRELGLLRIVAMTRRQIRKTIMIQAAIICIIGVVPGVLAGVGVAYLINLATMPVTGHAIDFVFRPWLLVATFLAALIIVVAAAYFPAERAARLELGKALQYE